MPKRYTWLVAAMWAVVLLGGAFRPSAQQIGTSPRPQVGYPAPAPTVVDLKGRPVSLADVKGKAVFVNFWASWCTPCRLEMPEIQRLTRDLPPGTAVLTVNVTARIQGPLTLGAMRGYLAAAGR